MKFQQKLRLCLVSIVTFACITFGEAQTTILSVPEQYATIQEAIDEANAGDTIIVAEGLYEETLTIDKALTLTAANFDTQNPVNNTTIIAGEGSDVSSAAISVESDIAGIVTVRGFVISEADNGVSIHSKVRIEYNYFHTGNDLVDSGRGGSGIIRGNVFFDAGDDAIDVDDVSDTLIIEANRLYNSHDDGIEIRLQPESAPQAPIDITIQNNQIIGNERTGIQLIDYVDDPQDTNRRFIVVGNLFANNGITAIGFMPDEQTHEDLSGADIVETMIVYNNTFYNNPYGLSGGDNLIAFNNIIVVGDVGASRVAGLPEDYSVVAYTLFYEYGESTLDSTIGDGNLYEEDPQFVYLPNPGPDEEWDTVDDDYSGLILKSTSAAIDAGIVQYKAADGTLFPIAPLADFTGLAPDLGWREFDTTSAANSR